VRALQHLDLTLCSTGIMGCGGSKVAETAVHAEPQPATKVSNVVVKAEEEAPKTPEGPPIDPQPVEKSSADAKSPPKMLEEEESSDSEMMVRIFYPEDISKRPGALPVIIYGHGRYSLNFAFPCQAALCFRLRLAKPATDHQGGVQLEPIAILIVAFCFSVHQKVVIDPRCACLKQAWYVGAHAHWLYQALNRACRKHARA
jgi:hypothetical protein